MKNVLKQVTPPILVTMARRVIKPKPVPADMIARPVFTNTWFGDIRANWNQLLSQHKPEKILEVGSFEGASACYLIETLGNELDVEIHCVDTWEGGVEHKPGGFVESDMQTIEQRFHHNTQLAIKSVSRTVSLVVHKNPSDVALSRLVADGKSGYFDLVYVDGSHQAPDVLFDAVAGFKLLKVGGILVFDDYLWRERLPYGTDLLRCPKPAVDAFVNLYIRELRVLNAPLGQLFVQRTST